MIALAVLHVRYSTFSPRSASCEGTSKQTSNWYSCVMYTGFSFHTFQSEILCASSEAAAVDHFERLPRYCRRTTALCQAPEDGSDCPRWGQSRRARVAAVAGSPRRRRNTIELFSWGEQNSCPRFQESGRTFHPKHLWPSTRPDHVTFHYFYTQVTGYFLKLLRFRRPGVA